MRMKGYCDVYKRTILKRTSPEVKCLHLTSSRREMCTSSVSDVIYHKFSHGAAFCTLNGKNVNVMLEFFVRLIANGNSLMVYWPFFVPFAASRSKTYSRPAVAQTLMSRLVYHVCFELILESLGKNPIAADLG